MVQDFFALQYTLSSRSQDIKSNCNIRFSRTILHNLKLIYQDIIKQTFIVTWHSSVCNFYASITKSYFNFREDGQTQSHRARQFSYLLNKKKLSLYIFIIINEAPL